MRFTNFFCEMKREYGTISIKALAVSESAQAAVYSWKRVGKQ